MNDSEAVVFTKQPVPHNMSGLVEEGIYGKNGEHWKQDIREIEDETVGRTNFDPSTFPSISHVLRVSMCKANNISSNSSPCLQSHGEYRCARQTTLLLLAQIEDTLPCLQEHADTR